MQEVALYDPNRKPAGWRGVILPSQYAVFLSDVETEAELTSEGSYLDPGMSSSCVIFDSLEETEQYCRRRVEDIPRLRCDVFDSQGKAQPPLATFVNQRHQDKLESPAKAARLMRWSLLPMAASLPFFWYTWKTRGEGWIASLFGIQFIFAGLRLLHWGYSMKEELGNRQARSELLRQRAGEARPGDVQPGDGQPGAARPGDGRPGERSA